MQYVLLIYSNESDYESATEEDIAQVMSAYNQFTRDFMASGKMVHGEALHPTAAATTVRLRDGELLTTDGPFAETKEQLGGFYIVNADNLDEAIQWAAKIPGAMFGSIEVRPIVDFSDQLAG